MAAPRISIRVRPDLRRRLQQEASMNGQSESELVRAALEAYFEAHAKRETCYALARRINLLGCVKNGPSDLSANREHFEGFGKP